MSLDMIDSLLDSTIEELADLKKFEALPLGVYRMGINWTYPDHDEYVAVQLALTNLECLEVPNVEEDKLPAVGSKAVFYMTIQRKDGEPMLFKSGEANTIGQGQLKEVLLAIAPAFNPDGSLTNRAMIEASEGAEVIVSLKTRKDKQDPDIIRNVIKNLTLPE